MAAAAEVKDRASAEGRRRAPDEVDAAVLLRALSDVKNGDFSVRLPVEWTGVAGKIADTLNEIVGQYKSQPDRTKRLRALVATFAAFNPARFHDPSGAGYRFLADQVLAVDSFNPGIAARLLEPLGQWARYQPELGALMRAELERIMKSPDLSKNVFELASKALA